MLDFSQLLDDSVKYYENATVSPPLDRNEGITAGPTADVSVGMPMTFQPAGEFANSEPAETTNPFAVAPWRSPEPAETTNPDRPREPAAFASAFDPAIDLMERINR
jgi:hypothetical protein